MLSWQMYHDLTSFWTTVKTIARDLVKEKYKIYPDPNDSEGPKTPKAVKHFVQRHVQELLTDMSFLYGLLDATMHTHFLSVAMTFTSVLG